MFYLFNQLQHLKVKETLQIKENKRYIVYQSILGKAVKNSHIIAKEFFLSDLSILGYYSQNISFHANTFLLSLYCLFFLPGM